MEKRSIIMSIQTAELNKIGRPLKEILKDKELVC
jgi:hypothetical protein